MGAGGGDAKTQGLMKGEGCPGGLGSSFRRSSEKSGVATSWPMSGAFARGSGLTFGFESGKADGLDWFCSSRGVKPVGAGTLPCGTNHVPARLDPPLPQG